MNEMFLVRGKLKFDNLPHKKGDWVYGNYVELKDGDHTIYCIYGFGEIIPETVGRYICMPDKNGKRIFEGDIIKGKHKKDLFIVEYSQSTAAFIAKGLNGYPYPVVCKGTMTYYEVIGNIHDSPALLNSADMQILNEITQNTLMPATPENFELMHG